MRFSIDSLEALPLISKLPFSGREKQILGAVTLFSSALFLFCISLLLMYRLSVPHEKPASADHASKEKTKHTAAVEHTPVKAKSKAKVKDAKKTEYDSLEREAIILAAEQCISEGNLSTAGEYLNKIADIRKQSARHRRTAAHLLIKQKRFAEAAEILEILRVEEPKNKFTAELYVLSQTPAHLMKTDLKKIVPGFENSPDILYAAAVSVLHDEPEEAAEFLLKALNRDPKHHRALYLLGRLYTADSAVIDFSKAVQLLSRAVQEAPDSAGYWNTLGAAQYLLWEKSESRLEQLLSEAEQSLLTAGRLNPQLSAVKYNLGEVYSQNESAHEKAEENYKEASHLNPAFWQAAFKLGILYQKNGKYSGAVSYFLKALQFSEENSRILHQLAVSYERSGNIKESQNTYEHIVRINPSDNIALYKLESIK